MPTTQPAHQPVSGAPAPLADGHPDRLTDQPQAATRSSATAPITGISQLAKLAGAIVAPTTLLTSLLFYFGW